MRFGKTFATYQLAKKMNWTKVLVLNINIIDINPPDLFTVEG
jgi:hypothetical protein